MKKTEVQQGVSAIDSAIKNRVEHFVLSGLEHVKPVLNKYCYHFDYKAEIEDYGLKKSNVINFTSTRLPCYFENFGDVFLYKLKDNQYLVNVPMHGKPMFGMSPEDIGECVTTIFDNPKEYKSKLVGLAADNLTIGEYTAIMNKHLVPNAFIDSHMTLEKFAGLGFPHAEELAIMFEFFGSGKMERDVALTKKLNKNLLSFEDWVVKNKKNLLAKLK